MRPIWYRRAVGRLCACGLLAMLSPVCGLCAPETEQATTAFLTVDRYELFQDQTLPAQVSLSLIPTQGGAPFSYGWSVKDPVGASADTLLHSIVGSTALFSPNAASGPYEIFGTVTDATGIQSTSRLVLHVGPPSGMQTSSSNVGVVAGGGSEGQATIQLNPQSGTPPYLVTWTAIGPDGRVDNDRIDATSALSPRFIAAKELGTYILTADIVDARDDKFTEMLTAIVRERSLLDVSAERSIVLPGGGAKGMLGLLATPAGAGAAGSTGSAGEPFEYDWEIIGPDGERHTDLLWDSQVRDPTFESGDLTGKFRVRCAARAAGPTGSAGYGTGEVMIGSTTIEVSEKISLEIRSDRFALVIGDSTDGQAKLVADIRGGVDPVAFDWQVSGPGGGDFTALLSSSDASETVFQAGDQPGIYVVRCALSDARGEIAAKAVALTVGESLGVAVSADKASPAIRGTTGHDSALLTARAYGGTPPYAYQWSALDPNGERAQSLIDAPAAQDPRFTGSDVLGPHAVYCKVTDSAGAVAVDSATLNVGQQLNVEVAADVQKLGSDQGIGNLAQLVARVQGGVPPYNYHWEATDSFGFTADSMLRDARAANPVVTGGAQADDTYRFTLTLTDALEATFVDALELVVEGQGAVAPGFTIDVMADRQRLTSAGGATPLSALAAGGVDPVAYEWSVTNSSGEREDDRLDVTDGSEVIFTSADSQGKYRILCTATDELGRGATDSVQLTVSDEFNIYLDVAVTHASAGDTVAVTVDRSGGTPNFIYSWQAVDESGLVGGSFTTGPTGPGRALQISADGATNKWIAPSAAGTYRLIVTATDTNGLTFSAGAIVSVTDAFVVLLSASAAHVAPGTSLDLAADQIGGSPDLTYDWSSVDDTGTSAGTFTEGSTGTGQASQVAGDDVVNVWTAPLEGAGTLGTYHITVTATDAGGSRFSETLEVQVIEPISLNLALGDVAIQSGGSTTIAADRTAGEGPFTYVWNAEDESGQPAGSFVSGSTDTGAATQKHELDDVSNIWIAPGESIDAGTTFTVTCTVVDSLGNFFSDSVQVVIGSSQILRALLSADKVFIAPAEAVNLAIEPSGGFANYSYAWSSLNEGDVSAGTFGSDTQTGRSAGATNTWTAPSAGTGTLGTYRISVTVTDATGASFEDSVPIVVRSPLSLNVTAADVFVFPSTSISLAAKRLGGEPQYDYTWSATDSAGSNAGTFTIGSSATGKASQNDQAGDVANSWTSGSEGTYTISCQVKDNVGQEFTDSVSIIVTAQEMFSLDLTTDKLVVSPGESVSLAANETSGVSPFGYTWSAINESGTSSGTLATVTQTSVTGDTTNTWTAPSGSTAEGAYRISCTVADAQGRLFTDAVTVEVSTLAIQNIFLDPAAADTISVFGVGTTLSSTAVNADPGQQITAGLTNPVHPRSVIITIIDVNVSIGGGMARVTGLDGRGLSQSEVITITASTGASTSHTGSTPFATVTQVDLFGFTGLNAFVDDVSIGVGTKFGLTGKLNSTNDVLYVNEGATVITTGFTVDSTSGRQGITFAAAPNGVRDYVVVFRAR